MHVEVRVPEVGESITEGILVEWYKEDGEWIAKDEPLFELETDKVTMPIVADVSGAFKARVEAGAEVQVGQIVCEIDTAASAPEGTATDTPAAPAPAAPAEKSPAREDGPAIAATAGLEQAKAKLAAAEAASEAPLSPAVRRAISEGADSPEPPKGSGKGGRLTKGDLVEPGAQPPAQAATPVPAKAPAPPASAPRRTIPATPVSAPAAAGSRERRVPMTSMRHRIAERLLEAQQNAAILTTFNELDMSNAMAFRTKHKAAFEKQHGVRLGFMSFFVKAVVDALKRFPNVNAQIQGDEIVYFDRYDIGVAIGTEKGLVVPVVRDADTLSFSGVEQSINGLAAKARDRKLQLNDLNGGTFSITNGGVYGSLMSTPILNPPQSGILGMHGIKKRPIAVGDEVVIRPMMYVALSYDHRLIDGKDAVSFLKRVVDCVEDPERLLFEV
jgi:2-oxoglutarate dehydrogenase E2 component (dihydrolipoamide succinyltransferase)